MNIKLLEVIACPICQGRLNYDNEKEQLVCRFDQLAYPINNGIPVLLAEQAIHLNSVEEDKND
ncbi:MAG: Trm112 family protein [Lonepinella koalarum]|nr:Trm112 family protein [Lonepinella koalarum]